MKRLFHRHRRLFAMGILLAFMAAWVLPAQACLADMATAATQTGCPDCPSPCPASAPCCATMAAAAMLPTAAVPVPSLDQAVFAPAILSDHAMPARLAVPAPAATPPRYSPPSTLSVRFCTFQE